MIRGYVKLWRKTLDSGLLQNPTAWQVFGWLLLNASKTKRRLVVAGQIFDLEPGECMTSVASMCSELKVTTKQCRLAIDLLKRLEIVAIRGTNRGTVFSLVNWGCYQVLGQADGQTEGQAEGQAKGKPIEQEIKKKNLIKNIQEYSLSELRPDDTPPDAPVKEEAPAAKRPSCPVQEIVKLYHATLPECPQVKILSKSRERAVHARWGEIGDRLREQGRPSDKAARMEYLTAFFNRAAESDFLQGRRALRDGSTYIVTFDKLMSPSGFLGVIEGKYDNR